MGNRLRSRPGAVFSLQPKNQGWPKATKVKVVSDDNDKVTILQQQSDRPLSMLGRETGALFIDLINTRSAVWRRADSAMVVVSGSELLVVRKTGR